MLGVGQLSRANGHVVWLKALSSLVVGAVMFDEQSSGIHKT